MLRALLDIAIKSRRINLILGAIDSTLVIKIQRKIAEQCKQVIWLQIFRVIEHIKTLIIGNKLSEKYWGTDRTGVRTRQIEVYYVLILRCSRIN